jgi:hypothetical protein
MTVGNHPDSIKPLAEMLYSNRNSLLNQAVMRTQTIRVSRGNPRSGRRRMFIHAASEVGLPRTIVRRIKSRASSWVRGFLFARGGF